MTDTTQREHPIPRYRAAAILAQRWVSQPNDIAPETMVAVTLGGGWCITPAGERIADRPMRPSEGAHIIADFIDEQVARAIVDAHNAGLDDAPQTT